jgi:predicted GIY-YIG superfamily endonuclease
MPKTYIYVIACKTDRFYVGMTANLAYRLSQHISGVGGAKIVKESGFDRLVVAYYIPSGMNPERCESIMRLMLKNQKPSTCSNEKVKWIFRKSFPESKGVFIATTDFWDEVNRLVLTQCVDFSSRRAAASAAGVFFSFLSWGMYECHD